MALTDLTQEERLDLTWIKPIYLIHIELENETLYLSDQNYNYTYGSETITYDPYVSNIADIITQIGTVNQESNFSFNLKLYNDPYKQYNHLSQLHNIDSFLSKKISIYEVRAVTKDEVFSSDIKRLIWTGYTEQIKTITKDSFIIVCSSRLYHLRDKLGIVKVNLTDFPSADPDDIGKTRNIIYGAVEHVPCKAVKAGVFDKLATDISSTDTAIYISGSSITEFPTSDFVIQIDEEKIYINSRSGNTLSVGTRGYDSTTATSHDKGSTVAEVLSQYVYEVAQHPVKSIDTVYVDDIRQISNFNVYTGQSGDQLSGYGESAVIEFTALPIIKQQVNLDVDQGSHTHDASSNSNSNSTSNSTANSSTTVSADVSKLNYPTVGSGSGFTNPGNAVDGTDATYAEAVLYHGNSEDLVLNHGMSNLGTLTEQYIHIIVECNTNSTYPDLKINWDNYFFPIGVQSGKFSKRINVSTHKTWNPSIFYIHASNPSSTDVDPFRCYIYEVWIESVYTPNASTTTDVDTTTTTTTSTSTSVNHSPATGVSLTGNSSANTVIGRLVTASVQGYQDDASGTYTGTANALIERPDHVIKHILIKLLGMSVDDIGDSFVSSGTTYSNVISGGYKFAFLANEISEKANILLYTLAYNCKSLFYDFHGKFELMYLNDNIDTPDEIIDVDDIIEDPVYDVADVAKVKNKINGYYRRDYRKSGSFGDMYMDMLEKQEDNGDMPTDIELKAVRISAMASHVLDYYLNEYVTLAKTVVITTSWKQTDVSPATTFAINSDLYNAIYRLQQLKINQRTKNIVLKGTSVSNNYPYGVDLKSYWSFDEDSGTTAADISGHGNDGTISFTNYLKGYWKFDEGSGTTVTDSSGNGNNGTITNPTWDTGVVGNALKADQISIPDDSSLDISDNITLSFWLKLDSYHTNYAEVLKKDSGTTDSQFRVYIYGNYNDNGDEGRIDVEGTAGGSWQALSSKTTKLNLNQWYHIAWTYNSTNGGQLYLNGEPYGSLHGSGTLALNDQPITSNLAHEYIDDLRIYNKVLTSEEIKSIYNTPTLQLPWVNGIVNNCLSFDGVFTKCNVDDADNINLMEVYTRTYSLWIKASSTSGHYTIHKEGGGVNGFAIYIENDVLYFTYWANSSFIGYCSIPFTYTTWQHITCVFDSINRFQGIYLNGQEGEGSHWQNNKADYVPIHAGNINIGYNDGDGFFNHTGAYITTSYYFSGLMDEYRLYNKVLTIEQIKTLYTYPKSII